MRRAFFAAACLALAACAPEEQRDEDVHVTCAFSPSPPRMGPAVAEIELHDAAGAPLAAKSVHFEGNMNHAGMVPEIADASEIAPGRYKAEFEFTMGGDWFVVIDAQLADGRSVQRTIPVPAVGIE